MIKIPKNLVDAILKNRKFIISSHMNPEGDSIGSQIAFRKLLLALGKSVHIVGSDRVPQNYRFIPGWECISRVLNNYPVDVLITLDCSNLSRVGKLKNKLKKDIFIINIDHHISNSNFGNINWVDAGASSTSYMVYALFKKLSVKIDKTAALALYTGLVSDTGSFRYSNTTYETFSAASELMKYKLPVYDIYHNIFGGVAFLDMKLVAEALLTLKYNRTKKVAWLSLEKKLLQRKRAGFDLGDLMLSLMRLISGVDVIVLFKEIPEKKNEIRINLRSNGRVNVNKLASVFGGGGHKTASSCLISGSIVQAEKKLLGELYKLV